MVRQVGNLSVPPSVYTTSLRLVLPSITAWYLSTWWHTRVSFRCFFVSVAWCLSTCCRFVSTSNQASLAKQTSTATCSGSCWPTSPWAFSTLMFQALCCIHYTFLITWLCWAVSLYFADIDWQWHEYECWKTVFIWWKVDLNPPPSQTMRLSLSAWAPSPTLTLP